MIVADDRDCFWLRSLGYAAVEVAAIPEGLSMLTSLELNDPRSPRIKTYGPRFADAPAPDPEAGDWSDWQALLASRIYDNDAGPKGAMAIDTHTGFGTVSSSLIGLPDRSCEGARPVWLFAPGAPGRADYALVTLNP